MLKLRSTLLASTLLIVVAVVLVGCGDQTATAPPQVDPVASDWQAGLDEDVVVALSELSDEDRQAVLIQKVCPVSDKPLGSMGKPPKVIIGDREVYLCCEACEPEIKSNADKYLEKLESNQG